MVSGGKREEKKKGIPILMIRMHLVSQNMRNQATVSALNLRKKTDECSPDCVY